jgi:hypothetical protein
VISISVRESSVKVLLRQVEAFYLLAIGKQHVSQLGIIVQSYINWEEVFFEIVFEDSIRVAEIIIST